MKKKNIDAYTNRHKTFFFLFHWSIHSKTFLMRILFCIVFNGC